MPLKESWLCFQKMKKPINFQHHMQTAWLIIQSMWWCPCTHTCARTHTHMHTSDSSWKNLLTQLLFVLTSVRFSSVAQSCPTLCDPMNRSTPGLPVHHQLLEFTQTHACWVGDAIQPSHPLPSPSPPALNPSQHQGLFQWFKVLEFQLQHQSFQWTPRTDLL